MFPTKRLLSTFTADKFSGRHILSDRNFLQVSERHIAPEDSLTSQADTTTTKQKETEQEEDSAGIICTHTVHECMKLKLLKYFVVI